MTIRAYAKCTICNFKMMLKIGEGSESHQPHIFDCPDCYIPITVALKKEKHGHRFECISNCNLPSPEEINELNNNIQLFDTKPSIINLHSSFAFDINSIHSAMGTMLLTTTSIGKINDLAIARWGHTLRGKKNEHHTKFIDIANFFDVPNCENIWNTIVKPYHIVSTKNATNRVEELKTKYITERKKYVPIVNVKHHHEIYYDFFSSMFYPRFNELYAILNNIVIEARKVNITEYNRFIEFYKDNRWNNSAEQLIQVFSNYYLLTTEFAQMRYYARASESDVERLVVGSKNFDNTKLFYGNAYEVISDEYIFLAGLYNITQGRNFDQFEHMTMSKYINDVNKDSRSNPLKQYVAFLNFLNEMDSTLRNGSHHASIRRDGDIVYYRSGGTGAVREIEYSKYLYLCNRLMILCSSLFCIEHKWINKSD